MAEHRETLSEDVGSKLLLLACMLAVFGGLALVLLPVGAALAPASPPAATQTATAPADGAMPATTAAAPATDTPPAPPTDSVAPAAAAAPEGPPAVVGAVFPGLIMLIVAAVLAALAGLMLGYAKARAEEGRTTDPATPH